MKQQIRTPNMRALVLAVARASAPPPSHQVAQVSMTRSADFAAYGIDDHVAATTEGYGR